MDPTVAKILARQRAVANRQGTSNEPAVHVHVHELHVHPTVNVPEIKIPELPAAKAPDVHVHAAPPTVEVHPPAAVQRKVDFELDEMGRIKAANVTDGR